MCLAAASYMAINMMSSCQDFLPIIMTTHSLPHTADHKLQRQSCADLPVLLMISLSICQSCQRFTGKDTELSPYSRPEPSRDSMSEGDHPPSIKIRACTWIPMWIAKSEPANECNAIAIAQPPGGVQRHVAGQHAARQHLQACACIVNREAPAATAAVGHPPPIGGEQGMLVPVCPLLLHSPAGVSAEWPADGLARQVENVPCRGTRGRIDLQHNVVAKWVCFKAQALKVWALSECCAIAEHLFWQHLKHTWTDILKVRGPIAQHNLARVKRKP